MEATHRSPDEHPVNFYLHSSMLPNRMYNLVIPLCQHITTESTIEFKSYCLPQSLDKLLRL
jgi:hypothetical protein